MKLNCWSEAEIPPEATCQGVALAKTEAEAGNTNLVAAEGCIGMKVDKFF